MLCQQWKVRECPRGSTQVPEPDRAPPVDARVAPEGPKEEPRSRSAELRSIRGRSRGAASRGGSSSIWNEPVFISSRVEHVLSGN